jgi:uncharacterized DUF497 family protein
VEITDSAGRHGITAADIRHALDHMFRYREQEYDGELRLVVIGPDATGRLLELVLVPAHMPQRVIHAQVLRRKFYDFL